MKKLLKALLMLACAFLITTFTGCKSAGNKNDITIRLYDVVSDCEVEKVVSNEDEITLDKVVKSYYNEYAKLFSDLEEDQIEFKKSLPDITILLDGDIVVLMFDKILENMGAQSEVEFIENLSYSITKNLPMYKGIRLSVNGKPYASGHLYYDLEELIVGE